EIAHRFREQCRREVDRFQLRAGFRIDNDPEFDGLIARHASSLKSYFVHGPARRFYPSTHDRESMADFIGEYYPEWLDRTIQEAGLLCDHYVNLFAYRDISLGPNIDWHRDPLSRFHWPLHYSADYDLVSAPPADAKIIHELNRHQHLPRLAKAFFLTNDKRYALE